MTGEPPLRREADGIATPTLNRPKKRNALNNATFQALESAAADLDRRTVVLGAGSRLSAGAGISKSARSWTVNYQASVLERLANLPQPLIAVVHGHRVTGGLEPALLSDPIIAAESARRADRHANFALVAGWAMTQRLPRRVGIRKAGEMTFTTCKYTGRDVERVGLANLCVPDNQLDEPVQSYREHMRIPLRGSGTPPAQGFADDAYRVGSRVAPDFAERVGGRFVLGGPR